MFPNGTNVPTVIVAFEVADCKITVPVPALILPPAAVVNVSAVRSIVALLLLMVLVPTARVPPAPVFIVTPAGPETAPFNVMLPLLARESVPEFALPLKLTAPAFVKFIFPAPLLTTADSVPAVVEKVVTFPIAPAAEVRLTVPAAPTLTVPAALLLMLPPTLTVTEFPVSVIVALLVNNPEPVLLKLRFAVVVKAPATAIF